MERDSRSKLDSVTSKDEKAREWVDNSRFGRILTAEASLRARTLQRDEARLGVAQKSWPSSAGEGANEDCCICKKPGLTMSC